MVVTWRDVDDALMRGRKSYEARIVRDTDGVRCVEFSCGACALVVPADRALDLFEHEQAEQFCRDVGVMRRAHGGAARMERGAMCADGVPVRVLLVLAQVPKKFWARYEVIQRVGSKSFVGWALWRAQQQGWVEVADDARNERYQRYRITAEGLRKIGRAQG